MRLITTNAINCGGIFFFMFAGVKNKIHNVRQNSKSSNVTILLNNSGKETSVPITPPLGALCPNAGASCKMIKIKPIPDINPDTTE